MKYFTNSLFINWATLDYLTSEWANFYFGSHVKANAERDESDWSILLSDLTPNDRQKFDALFEVYDSEKDYESDAEWGVSSYIPSQISNKVLSNFAGFKFPVKSTMTNYDGVLFLSGYPTGKDKESGTMNKIPVITESIFSSDAALIVHQTNCKGVMGAGIAMQIKELYPEVQSAYQEHCRKYVNNKLLGSALIVPTHDNRYVANCFGQDGFGRSSRQTDYAALRSSMTEVREFAETHGNLSVAIPYNIGCGLAGGEWTVVEDIINEVFLSYDKVCFWRRCT